MSPDVDKATSIESEDSLKKRYLFKVVASIVALAGNLIVYAIVPRALGPAGYGNFNFLSNFFSQLVGILDGRSSVGALVKASQRPEEKGLVISYFYYMFFVSAMLFSAIGVSYLGGFHEWIWPGQEVSNIYLAALWGLLIWYHSLLHKLCDAYGYTVMAELVRIFQKVFAISLLVLFYIFDFLTLQSFFFYYILTLVILVFGFAAVLFKREKMPSLKEMFSQSQAKTKGYFKEYYIYTFPLLLYISLESLMLIFDRWLLQYSSGAQEQGYFSLGFDISAISSLFIVSIAALIEREFSIAHGGRNEAQLRYLFQRYIPLLFGFTAFFSCFSFFFAENIIQAFAGDRYSGSVLVIIIMSGFQIFFTFGRILGSVYFATGENKLYRNIGFVFFLSGGFLSFILVGPSFVGGLQLGALGLALKMVLVYGGLITTQFYFICRVLGIRPGPLWINQAIVVLFFLGISYVSTLVIDIVSMGVIVRLLTGGFVYTILVGLFVACFPRLFGLTNIDIAEVVDAVLFRKPVDEELDITLPQVPSSSSFVGVKKIALLSARNSIHTVRWANGLAENGFKIILISMHDGGDPLHPNVEFHKLTWKAPMGYFTNIFQLRKILKEQKPDLLHVHFVSGYGTLGSLSGFQPRVLSVWGTDIFNFPYLSQINKALIYYNLHSARWICSTSWVMAKQTASIYKTAVDKMTVTPFGVDLDRFKKIESPSHNEDIVIGTIKTLSEKYGIDTLIQGFAKARERLLNSHPEMGQRLRLVICGKGPQEMMLKNMATELGVGEVTDFKGFIPHAEIPKHLNDIDIYVAMSREESESFGVAIIEASACEVPVVVSNFGGLPEVVSHGETGYVAERNTPEVLSDRLVELILDEKQRQKMGEMGRQRVQAQYAWQENVKLMERVYQHVLQEGR